jgi:hypothetical protein
MKLRSNDICDLYITGEGIDIIKPSYYDNKADHLVEAVVFHFDSVDELFKRLSEVTK